MATRYRVVEAPDKPALKDAVNSWLEKGWTLHGSLVVSETGRSKSITYDTNGFVIGEETIVDHQYAQTMVKL